jgi:hypothetical protein
MNTVPGKSNDLLHDLFEEDADTLRARLGEIVHLELERRKRRKRCLVSVGYGISALAILCVVVWPRLARLDENPGMAESAAAPTEPVLTEADPAAAPAWRVVRTGDIDISVVHRSTLSIEVNRVSEDRLVACLAPDAVAFVELPDGQFHVLAFNDAGVREVGKWCM